MNRKICISRVAQFMSKPPDIYLGTKLERKSLNANSMRTMCNKDYIKLTISNIEDRLKRKGMKLPNKVTTPMNIDHRPEFDFSPELGQDKITFHQEIIGMLRWAIPIDNNDNDDNNSTLLTMVPY